jgi:non-heme chloroperoxidase
VPVLAMNGDADQVVPHDTSGPRTVKLVQNGTLKTYPGYHTARCCDSGQLGPMA